MRWSARSFRLVEPFLRPDHASRRETTAALRAARIRTFPEWYLARTLLASLAGGLVVALVVGALLALASPRFPLWGIAAIAVWSGILGGASVRLVFLLYPRMRANTRREKIEEEYQSAIVLCYALARGGMPAMEIFRTVAQEKETYGEVCKEFDCIVRDVEMFGYDIVKAIQMAGATTPSPLLKGFFEGLVSILNSGADPRDYFKRQVEQQLGAAEARMEEQLGRADMLAEIYVSSLLVLPLLILVVLSGLSRLGNGHERFIPPVAYGLIPAGTLFYLVLLEVSMPSAQLAPPPKGDGVLVDFGIDALHAPPGGNAGAAAAALAALPLRVRVRSSALALKKRLLGKPDDALNFSGPLALLVLLVGGALLVRSRPDAYTLQYVGVVLLFAAFAVALAPVALFHELRLSRAHSVEGALPDMLSKLAGFNERGIGLLQSFQIIARSTTGPLAQEMRILDRDVQVNGNLQGAVRRLRDRVRTLRMTKLAVLLERASRSTSSLKEVLDIAAHDETRTQTLVARKRQTMMSYVLVIYIVFAVFLYVAYMTTTLFYGGASFVLADATGTAARGMQFGAEEARLLFFHAVVLQGTACGLVAGRLGEGFLLSGVKHALALGGIALLVFALGVM